MSQTSNRYMFLFVNIMYRLFSIFMHHCSIKFPYRIRKVIRNIFINIQGYKDPPNLEINFGSDSLAHIRYNLRQTFFIKIFFVMSF